MVCLGSGINGLLYPYDYRMGCFRHGLSRQYFSERKGGSEMRS